MASTKSNYCRAIVDAHAIYAPLTEASQQEPIGLLVYYMTLALHRSAKRKSADHDAPGLCEHASKWDEPLPPVVSAKLTTKDKFSFQYGTAEIRLRVPVGKARKKRSCCWSGRRRP